MSLDKEILKKVANKRYTEFSDVIKSELREKLKNHSRMIEYTSKYDEIQKHKQLFKSINDLS